MEFSPRVNRGNMPPQQHTTHPTRKRGFDWNGRAVRIEWFIFTALVAIILLLAIGWLIFTGGDSGESKRVDATKYQAVFLNGGVTSGSVSYSTYFGHITKLNDKYFVLNNVYYLTDQGSNSGQSSPQLTKLGCQQLHSPYDEMVINRSQVAFWENLQDSGKVVQAIKQFQQQNPNGPNCNQTTNSNSSSPQTTSPSPNSR
jgi:hypothetical protein